MSLKSKRIDEKIRQYVNTIYSDFIIASKDFNNLFDRYLFAYNPNYDTASWRFSNPDIHQIVIGNVIKESRNEKEQKEIIKNYIYHEMAHSTYTMRDIHLILAKLIKNKIDFGLYNLFEDARIESLWSKEYDYTFSWYKFQNIKAEEADVMFYKIIQTVNNKNKFPNTERPLYLEVLPFYLEAIDAHDIDIMIDVINRFKKKFEIISLSDKFCNFNRPSNEFVDIKVKKGEKSIFDRKDLQSIDTSDKTKEYTKAKDRYKEKRKFDGDYNFIGDIDINKKDQNLVNEIIQKMMKIFKSRIHNNAPSNRGKRINPTRMALDSDKIFNSTMEVKNKNRLKLTLVIDMSGSMELILYETINIVYAINELSKTQYFDTTLLLSSANGYQKLYLPCEENIINKIEFATMDGEGLEKTFHRNIQLLQDSKNIIVITDGWIMDDDIDKEKLNDLRIRTLGIYIAKSYEDMKETFLDEDFTLEVYESEYIVDEIQLLKWFDKAVVKENVLDVIEEIINQGFRL